MIVPKPNLKFTNLRFKTLISVGFSAIFVLLMFLIAAWIQNLSDNKTPFDNLAIQVHEIGLITSLLESTHHRAMALGKLKAATNRKQGTFAWFQGHGKDFDAIRGKILAENSNFLKQLTRVRVRHYVETSWDLEQRAMSLFETGNINTAYSLLTDEMLPLQGQFMSELTQILSSNAFNTTSSDIGNINEQVSAINDTAYILVFLLGFIALLLALLTIFIVKRTGKTEAALVDQGERIRALYEVTSQPGICLDGQIDAILELGCRVLKMEIGKVGRQDPANNASTCLNIVAPPELPVKRGLVFPLDKTFCHITFESDGPIAIQEVSKSKYKDHPAADFLGVNAYIGTTIHVNGEKFGTINFANRKPRAEAFTETDRDFVNLCGKWISVTMEQQVAKRELQVAKEAAEAANQAKTSFLASMSHEIRTPLTAILGYSEMLLDEDQSREEMQHEISSIIKGGGLLQAIINDILDLSKIEAGQLVMEKVSVSPVQLVQEVATLLGPRAREKELYLEIDYDFPLPQKINSDPTRIKQILINLCGNAIKFTSDGGITLAIAFLEHEHLLQFTVTDTGIGMTDEEMERIFNPFTQADSSITRKFGGTGLGLCISQQLARKLGGDVSVASETGKGSVFTAIVSLGMEPDDLELDYSVNIEDCIDNNITPIRTNTLAGRVLLVEDNPENQRIISKYLTKIGAVVDIVDNGKLALESARMGNYDLVIMDVQMPVMDGLEATIRLRVSGYETPIICLTANAMQEDEEACINAGANDYLTKPLSLTRFYDMLSRYLEPREESDGVEISKGVGTQAT